jgi:acyl carrier protein
MNDNEILEKLVKIFRDIFDDESLIITTETSQEDIEDWDSLGHVYLITEIEDEFGIDLSEEGAGIQNVNELLAVIKSKLE